MKKIGFIGGGKVAFSLGQWFVLNNVLVSGYYSRNPEQGIEAAKLTDSNYYNNIEDLIGSCDVIFIAVTDDGIIEVYNNIKKYDIKGKYICHCSGVLSSYEAFADIREKEAFGFSIHPLLPISDKHTGYKELNNALFCIEGDERPVEYFEDMFTLLGRKVQIIDGNYKKKYHAACVIASNLMCALAAESIEMLESCGFGPKEAEEALAPLMESNIKHILEDGVVESLTGPVERCDIETVNKHLKVIEKEDTKAMYISLSNRLIKVAKSKHPDIDYKKMEEILNS